MGILKNLFQKKDELPKTHWAPAGYSSFEEFNRKKREYFENAPPWFYDEKLLESFAKETGYGGDYYRPAWVEIRAKISSKPTDNSGRRLVADMNGLGTITAEGHNGGEGHLYWTFRPHNFDCVDGFGVDYNMVYSFYDHDLNLVKECRLSDLSETEAVQLFKRTWCLTHEFSAK